MEYLFIPLMIIAGILGIVYIGNMERISHLRSKHWLKMRKNVKKREFLEGFYAEKSELSIPKDIVLHIYTNILKELDLKFLNHKLMPNDKINEIVDLVTIDESIEYDHITNVWELMLDLAEKAYIHLETKSYRIRTAMNLADLIELKFRIDRTCSQNATRVEEMGLRR